MIQSKNDFFQFINRLEVQISHLVNTMNDKNKETFSPNFWPFSIFLAILIGTKNLDVLKMTLINIQFHHNILNLTNYKPWTNWHVFTSKKLNLIVNVTPIPKFVIQFQFFNLC